MSEKIGLARAKIVDLLSLILRTHSRDELFSLFRSAEGITPKADPEAWREEYRKKQAAGVRFEILRHGKWRASNSRDGMFIFNKNKEDYREVPQESPKVKEIGVGIPEAARNILIAWQRSGLKFLEAGEPVNFPLKFDCTMKGNYTIPEQPIPEGMSVEMVEAMWQQGLMLEFDGNFGWDLAADGFDWNGIYRGAQLLARLRILAQPIPEKLLEVTQPAISPESLEMRTHRISEAIANIARNYCADKGTAPLPKAIRHAEERALWKAQREAGTNEIWQVLSGNGVADIRVDVEPNWHPDFIYRVKPMKLNAKISRREVYKTPYDWEFTGTREEYRAECEKYGYVVISEIEEVKPKTVTYYFALCKTPDGCIGAKFHEDKQRLTDWIITCCGTIIGDIEEREIEA